MTDKYTIKNATDDLALLMPLTRAFETDADGFWIVDGKRYEYRLDKNEKALPIVLFQDPMPKGEFHFFNPFSEGLGKKSPAVQLFYRTIRMGLTAAIVQVIKHVLSEILLSKTDETHALSPAIIRMTSLPVEKKMTFFEAVDDTTEKEFTKILDERVKDILHPLYNYKQMTTSVSCDLLTDPKWDEKYGEGIRKKTIKALKTLVMGILGIKDPAGLDEFKVEYDPDLKSSAHLHTTLMTYLKIYRRFNDVLDDDDTGRVVGASAIDLGALQDVIDRLPLAYAIAKHLVQPTLTRKSVQDISPADTSHIPRTEAGVRKSRWGNNEAYDDFGRPIRDANSGPNRFRRDAPRDPYDDFEAAVKGRSSSASQDYGRGAPAQNRWGQSSGGGLSLDFGRGMSGGLDLRASNNFGDPMRTRNYF